MKGDLVLGEIYPVLVLYGFYQPVNDPLVPVVSAEVVVAVGGLYLDCGEAVVILADFQKGDVEGSASKVKDQYLLVFISLFKAVGQGGRGGLVYNP